MRRLSIFTVAAAILTQSAFAAPDDFHPGPVIKEFGKVATVKSAPALPKDTVFKVAFDVTEAAEPGKLNRRIESAARFINMNAEAGIPPKNIHVAIVVHGGAHKDLVTDEKYGGDNANAELIAALIKAGAQIRLCGQTAAYYDVKPEHLLPGVKMSLSAMTAHALLQNKGYTLNPS